MLRPREDPLALLSCSQIMAFRWFQPKLDNSQTQRFVTKADAVGK
jgi:hypothetical protein